MDKAAATAEEAHLFTAAARAMGALPDTPPLSETTRSTPQAFARQGEVDTQAEEAVEPIQIDESPPHSEEAVGRSTTTFTSAAGAPHETEASAEAEAYTEALNTTPVTKRMPPLRRGGRARQPTKRKADLEAIEPRKRGRPARKA